MGIGRYGSNRRICQSSAPVSLANAKGKLDAPMQYDERANGSEIEAEVGENFELSLSETRTAGHRWVTCQLLEELAQPNSGGLGGAPSCLGGF